MNRTWLLATGLLAVVIIGIIFIMQIGITPTDTKIVTLLSENEDYLLNIEWFVGASIARDEDNHIIGVAVYIQDDADTQQIPDSLNGFTVYVKQWIEATDYEKDHMIIKKPAQHE